MVIMQPNHMAKESNTFILINNFFYMKYQVIDWILNVALSEWSIASGLFQTNTIGSVTYPRNCQAIDYLSGISTFTYSTR